VTTRRDFLGFLAALPALQALRRRGNTPPPVIEVRPTALYAQPDGRRNLVRVTVAGLDAPAARAQVIGRHGELVGTAGLLRLGEGLTLQGEVWVPLSEPTSYQIALDVGKQQVARQTVRLTPPKRWTLYWLSCNHTDVGYTDLQERCLEIHRENLDAALKRLGAHPDYRWTAECALQVISYVENRAPDDAEALCRAIREGKVGWSALFANLLTGLLDHDTATRMVLPAARLAKERGLPYVVAQLTDVPGQGPTFPMILAASGVKYLATGPNPDRALPLLSRPHADAYHAGGGSTEWLTYPQLYWWEGPDGSRVLHWRNYHYGDALRFGFDVGADEMGRRLSEWLLDNPVFQSPDWPTDIALLYGAQWDNAPADERLVTNLEEYGRRVAFPRIVPGRAEDFFRDVERRWGPRLPVRRGDSGTYWEDGAASTAAELAWFRRAQLAARAAGVLALWDERLEPNDEGKAARLAQRQAERRSMWRDLLLFGEHTWGAAGSVSDPDARQTVAQWAYKRRFLEGGAAAAETQVAAGLLRLAQGADQGRHRVVFNAASWERTDVARVPGGAGKTLTVNDTELPTVDLEGGDALLLARGVPALGYLTLRESDRQPRPPVDEGEATDAATGGAGFKVRLDAATGAVRSLQGPDGKERVKPSAWSGLNQLVYVRGGERSALWTTGDRRDLVNPPQLEVAQARLVHARRQRLPGIGVRLVAERQLEGGFAELVSTVTLYDELPWVDFENRLIKSPTLTKEALYVVFPLAFVQPTVEVEVPLGRMTVERDQQPGSCRDWYCHQHWVWLHEGTDGVLWSGPDTPLFTLNDLVRGEWRRRIAPDGTLFAYAMNNYWFTNYAARQGGPPPYACRFRLSLLAPGDAAEPVRRGWGACDPLAVSAAALNPIPGALIGRDSALIIPDKGALVVSARPADDGNGAVVTVLDVVGQARTVGIWPAALAFTAARRANLVETDGDSLAVGGDRHVSLDVAAWGCATARLFTSRAASG
jgi:alpha-mannosidase